MMLENQTGISPEERVAIEREWTLYGEWGLLPNTDRVRYGLIQRGATLVRPTLVHRSPGGVKVNDGVSDVYLRPLSQPCTDDGCQVYLWDDEDGTGFWMQHGANDEAVRHFPKRFFLSPAFPCSSERPDVLEWLCLCHDYINPARARR